MKLKEILMGLFIVNVLATLYYLPQTIESISKMVIEGYIIDNFSFVVMTFIRLGLTGIGVVGMFQFWQNKNIFNPYLKAFFIYDLFAFFVFLPSNISVLFNNEVLESLGWSFYFFRVLSLVTAVFIVLVYSKETIRVNVTPGKKKRIRFFHWFIDSIIFIVFQYQIIAMSFFGIDEIVLLFASYLYLIFYYWISETVFQQTLGKLATGKYVRREDGNRAGTFKILGRTLSRFIPFEPFSFFSYPIRGWHDSISKTTVYSLAENQELEDEILDHLIGEDDDLEYKL